MQFSVAAKLLDFVALPASKQLFVLLGVDFFCLDSCTADHVRPLAQTDSFQQRQSVILVRLVLQPVIRPSERSNHTLKFSLILACATRNFTDTDILHRSRVHLPQFDCRSSERYAVALHDHSHVCHWVVKVCRRRFASPVLVRDQRSRGVVLQPRRCPSQAVQLPPTVSGSFSLCGFQRFVSRGVPRPAVRRVLHGSPKTDDRGTLK